MPNLLRFSPLALPLLMACDDLNGEAGVIVDLEATSFEICGIDDVGNLDCANTEGESWGFEEMLIGSNSYIQLGATNQSMCALEDNDGDGAGDIYCFIPENLALADLYDVYEGPYTSFSINNHGLICALDSAGEIECIDPPADWEVDTLPAGPFVDSMIFSGAFSGICGLAADGTLTCSGAESFEDWTLGPDCVFPTTDVIDMDILGDLGMVLTADGTVTGWSGWEQCYSASAPGAVALEQGGGTVCTLAADGAITCVDIDDWTNGNSLSDGVPTGSFEMLAGNPMDKGEFMCASAGSEVTCWGDGWEATTPHTFELIY